MAKKKSPASGPTNKQSLAKIRNAQMLSEKMANPQLTNAQLAEKYRISPGAVGKGLKAALSNGTMVHYEQQLFDQLVPRAMAVLEWNLDNNMDPAVAMEILKGAMVMKRPGDAQHFYQSEDEESLEAYIKIKRKKDNDNQPAKFDSTGVEKIIEAEAIRVRQTELPPSAPPIEGQLVSPDDLARPAGIVDDFKGVEPNQQVPPRDKEDAQ
jgi:hypothetical protein